MAVAHLPAFMAARLFIDLADPDKSESELQKPIKHLYGLQNEEAPPLGSPPTHVLEAGLRGESTRAVRGEPEDGDRTKVATIGVDLITFVKQTLLNQQAVPPPDRPL